jgi:type 1 glutamine amidotransferase
MTILATAFSDKAKGGTGKDEPMALVKSYGKGRVFHTPMGHDLRAMKDPSFMLLTARGTEWAATGKVTVKEVAAQ